MNRILLIREIQWSFRGVLCYAEWPISCFETDPNQTKRQEKVNLYGIREEFRKKILNLSFVKVFKPRNDS